MNRQSQGTEAAKWEPKIVAFLCSWCGYTGVDQVGAAHIQYPANVRIIRVPCSGRVDPMFVLKTLQRGMDGVMVVGCRPGNCHYGEGNHFARRRLLLTKSLLEHLGVEPGRIHVSWLGAAEGPKFARTVEEVVQAIRALGPPKALVKCNSCPSANERDAEHSRNGEA